jgi:hypothetical protein
MHIRVYVMIPITEYSENYENGDSSTHIYSEFESKVWKLGLKVTLGLKVGFESKPQLHHTPIIPV